MSFPQREGRNEIAYRDRILARQLSGFSGLGFTIPIIGVDTNDIQDVVGLTGLFGGGKPGLPQAQSVVTKWYVWYLGRQPDDDGLHHWIDEINKHQSFGPSWANFSSAPESVQKNAAGRAAEYERLGYGSPFDDPGYQHSLTAPPLTQNVSFAPATVATVPGSYPPAPIVTSTPFTPRPPSTGTASLGGVSTSTVLIGAAVIAAVVLFSSGKRRR